MQIEDIQQYLSEHKLDAWLMADFHGRNEVAIGMMGISGMLTRRAFYLIPAGGKPTALVHKIEAEKFKSLPGDLVTYSSYKVLETELINRLHGFRRIAMEYSPNGRLPYIGLVDAGTVDLVRDAGVEVVSSADLVAHFGARLTSEQMAMHRMAARNLIEIKGQAFGFIAESIRDGKRFTEYDVCEYIRERFREYDMEAAVGPNCSVDAHAGDPHYEPSPENASEIKRGQLVLIDLWARMKQPKSVYGDITWMAFAGKTEQIPEKYSEIFAIVAQARDAAVTFLRENIDKRPVAGYEVDDVCRRVIKDAGYGRYFVHRTGHSITTSEHGNGPNIDNLETEDRRHLQKGHLFSIEPGIYTEEWGFRSEINVLISHEGVEVTTLPLQREIVALF